MDYLHYWSLLRKPFVGQDHPFFFAGTPQREALARLNQFVTGRVDSASLVARSGCGMTCLLRHVERMHGFGDCAAEVVLTPGTQRKRQQVYRDLCGGLGYQPVSKQASELVDQAIAASARHDVSIIWLIDRCRSIAARVAGDLAVQHANLSVLTAITASELAAVTAAYRRSPFRIGLSPLTLADTQSYLAEGIRQAGGTRCPFPDATVRRIHQVTEGVLADLSVTAESALSLAARNRMKQVEPDVIDAIDEHLSRAA